MFSFLSSLFSKKAKQPIVQDIVWISTESKQKAIENLLQTIDIPLVLIAFFPNTEEKMQRLIAKYPNANAELHLANRLSALRSITNKKIVLLEHFPLTEPENTLLNTLIEKGLTTNIDCHSALDEPLLSLFNANRIIDIMQKLGMKEDEPIQHSLVTQAMANARKKIADKVGTFASDAASQEEWLKKNYKP